MTFIFIGKQPINYLDAWKHESQGGWNRFLQRAFFFRDKLKKHFTSDFEK